LIAILFLAAIVTGLVTTLLVTTLLVTSLLTGLIATLLVTAIVIVTGAIASLLIVSCLESGAEALRAESAFIIATLTAVCALGMNSRTLWSVTAVFFRIALI
jgi:hypothetical protein